MQNEAFAAAVDNFIDEHPVRTSRDVAWAAAFVGGGAAVMGFGVFIAAVIGSAMLVWSPGSLDSVSIDHSANLADVIIVDDVATLQAQVLNSQI